MKVVVFGGSGFLGSHVCDKLTLAGHDVTIFDIRDSSWRMPQQKFIEGDILDLEQIVEATRDAQAVFNFAGIADIDEAKNTPINTARFNILGNVNILEACRINNVKRFVFASSMYVYSRSGSFYRVSKKACEEYIENYQQSYGLDFTILRYGTLYGNRSDRRNAIYRYISSALKDKKIVYDGDLTARRDYIHVEDAALASVEILKDEYANQNIILTGSQTFQVGDLFRMIKEMLHNEVEIVNEINPHKTAHYVATPYSFNPKPGRKFIPGLQVDLGQGLLGVIEEVYSQINGHGVEE